MRRKTTKFPGFPQGATLGPHQRVVNSHATLFSPVWSMTCATLHRLVQALSTSVCFVSNFENQSIFETYTRSSRTLYETLTPAPVDRPFVSHEVGSARKQPATPRRRSAGASGARGCGKEVAEPACKPGSVVDSHSSRRIVTDTLEQPTRTRRGPRHEVPIWSCSRWGLPCRPVTRLAVRSYRTISPLPSCRGSLGRYLSVALSVGSRRPGVTWHRALWSPDFPRHRSR